MVKKMVAECVDLFEAKEIVEGLLFAGKKITVDPLNGKFWIYDHGVPRK